MDFIFEPSSSSYHRLPTLNAGGSGAPLVCSDPLGSSIILSIYCLASFRRPHYCSCPSLVWLVSPSLVREFQKTSLLLVSIYCLASFVQPS